MSLNGALQANFGAGLRRISPVSGGDINDAFRLTLTDGTRVFMKANRTEKRAFFQAEADGLSAISDTKAIRVPQFYSHGTDDHYGIFLLLEWVEAAPQAHDFWETFGRSLAEMHKAGTTAHFGWRRDNYIGTSPQKNTGHDSWIAFYRDCRLVPQFRNAQHYFDGATHRRITRLLDHLDDYLLEPSQPSLLHGDLWSGNYIAGPDGQAWLIDPAVYVGHAEADLAMTELFGGFHPRFYTAYLETNPLQPGYEHRRDLYNLYHLLNHLNLFGPGYLLAVLRILNDYS